MVWQKIGSNSVETIYIDNNDIVWVGTFNGGMDFFDTRNNHFTHYTNYNWEISDKIAGMHIWDIVKDKNQTMWIAALGRGIDTFNIKKRVFHHLSKNVHSVILCLLSDSNGNVWAGSEGGGLYKYEWQTKQFINFQNNQKDSSSIGSNVIRSLFEDNN